MSAPDTTKLNDINFEEKFDCLIVGRGTLPVICADLALQKGHRVVGVVSADELFTSWAVERGIAIYAPTADLHRQLAHRTFDYLFSINNDFIVPGDVLKLARRFAINFHDAPLPRYAGTNACCWALMNGERVHGITWHVMEDQVDGGDILIQRPLAIADDDTTFTLTTKCFDAAIATFAELLELPLCGRQSATAQDLQQRTFFSRTKRPTDAGVLSWNRTASELLALSRALDFGSQVNPMGLPKLMIEDALFIVSQLNAAAPFTEALPGTITKIDHGALTIATARGELSISELLTLEGEPAPVAEIIATYHLKEGDRLGGLNAESSARVTALQKEVGKHEGFWVDKLKDLRPPVLSEQPWKGASAASNYFQKRLSLPEEVINLLTAQAGEWEVRNFWLAAIGSFLSLISGETEFDLGVSSPVAPELSGLFSALTPLRIRVSPAQRFVEAYRSISQEAKFISDHKTFARDVVMRYPELRAQMKNRKPLTLPVAVEIVENFDDRKSLSASPLTFVISENLHECQCVFDTASVPAEQLDVLLKQFVNYLSRIARNPDGRIADRSLLSPEEQQRLLVEWNDTAVDWPTDVCLHELFEQQAALTPDAVAVVCKDAHLTYRELDRRANQLANYLRKLGIVPDSLVGLSVDRSLEMMVGLMGILKAGGAYVPLDPTYPNERLKFMLEDSQAAVLLTQSHLAQQALPHGVTRLLIDGDWQRIAQESSEKPVSLVAPTNLAYVMYTSGSTGEPKGVMIEHRNVVNFFAGMDQAIGGQSAGVWLAVTSISFDISVLELFWTLARGFKVVLYDKAELTESKDRQAYPQRKIDFSLFYFASTDDSESSDKYRLLIEGAKYADKNGFSAVWTPERHFHPFGGLYPNPSVISAAIAAVTESISIRAGSVVAPLHSPIRIAEEWAIVDNLSNGRVGLSFAAGWHDRDFILAPQHYEDRKQVMLEHLNSVRKLWRGETLTIDNSTVRSFPQPIQPELPFWLTAGGNPETFRLAGQLGANVLTHLLFQKPEDIAERISIYRQAWRDAGHPGEGHVTIMLHTFMGEDFEQVREQVKRPFCNYLKSSVDLIQQVTQGMGLELKEEGLTDTDIEAILDYAFARYFDSSGLLGTVESCLQMVSRLKALGVDEIGCLIDFGIDTESALGGLRFISELKKRSESLPDKAPESIPELIRKHHITHLQCTPSMARMLAADAESLQALGALDKLLLGGEAVPATLVEQLGAWVRGDLINMYGPTETTIWSTTHRFRKAETTVLIGRPIANTEIYVVDGQLQPVPVGKPGELLIGGAGVARGYLKRSPLTADKFIPNPFGKKSSPRLYRTGDLARYREDGSLEFLGRIDQQVKIRGFRIEAGEIEEVLLRHEGVSAAAVMAQEDAADEKRLFAYVSLKPGQSINELSLKRYLQNRLPEQMIPAAIITLERLPLTPNGKVDRQALAAIPGRAQVSRARYVAPQNDLQRRIAEVWQAVLKLESVGLHDNFFDIGGDSLLAVRATTELRQATAGELKLVDLFKHPTVSELATFLLDGSKEQAALQESQGRAAARRELRSRKLKDRQEAPALPTLQA